MLQAAEGLLFLGLVVIAFDFFGAAILRLVAPAFARDHGMAIAFGVALFFAYSGVLEAAELGSPLTLLAPVAIGIGGAGVAAFRGRKIFGALGHSAEARDWRADYLFVAFVLGFVLFLLNAASWSYGNGDDSHGYLVLPERILSVGSTGRDPFLYRRIEAGLSGGGSYLYALFRAALDLRQTKLADLGLGSIALLLLVWGHAREYGASRLTTIILALVALCIIALSPIYNIAPDTIGKALLYALLRLALGSGGVKPSAQRGAAFALIFFGVSVLKTSFLPPAAAAVAAFYLSAASEVSLLALAPEALCALAVTLGLMAPWMIAMEQIAGTPWYPFFGLGSLRPEEARGIAIAAIYAKNAGRLMIIMALPALIAASVWRDPRWRHSRLFLVLLVALSSVAILLAQTKFTVSGFRYGHMGPATVLLFFVVVAFGLRLSKWTRNTAAALFALSVIVMAVRHPGYDWAIEHTTVVGGDIVTSITHQPRGPEQWRDDRQAEYRTMQDAVPPGQHLLVMLSWPSLLDFRRNRIFVMDWPGMAGPPGMPAPDDPKAWAAYLVRNDIRYVAYSYGDQAGMPIPSINRNRAFYSQPGMRSSLQVAYVVRGFQMHQTFLSLRARYKPVFDDGKVFAVELPDHP